jgi:iron complex transport system ATP-binding protein
VVAKDVEFGYEEPAVVRDFSTTLYRGDKVGIIGPNGSGKSTLLKQVYRVLKPKTGKILIDNEQLDRLSSQALAQKIAVVAQEVPIEFDFSVKEIVMMGRYPYKSLFENDTAKDLDIVLQALEEVDMLSYLDRSFLTLSGGEKQRVLIARALAQTTDFLILDEPTNHLDPGSMLHIMDIIKNLDLTTFAAIHDLNIASLYCDRIFVMNDGYIVKEGTPEDIFEPDFIFEIFGVQVTIDRNPVTQKPQITYIPDYLHDSENSAYSYSMRYPYYHVLEN